MSGVNKAIIVGRLGKDPEARTLESGAMVVNFTLATSEVYKDRVTGERKETTDWHNIVLWRGLAETAAKYLHKGDQVYIEGKMRTRSWEKDGVTRYTTEVIGDNMTLLGSKPGGNNSGSYEKSTSTTPVEEYKPTADNTTDDLPF
ncbi:MAG: Single-stranded DNA-binding protein [Cytophagales bacterium]|jgi:single-strand DNA-binding protein|nr:single-stranded DNA-binding protein [Bacteroidota bacterium]MBS1980015.1 single-stranded DNA-binding protein [Bacteroidota bacterium]WHZ07235.1 MAG: Single-stranded DNA-binding protein [Cytophagales bacterium]